MDGLVCAYCKEFEKAEVGNEEDAELLASSDVAVRMKSHQVNLEMVAGGGLMCNRCSTQIDKSMVGQSYSFCENEHRLCEKCANAMVIKEIGGMTEQVLAKLGEFDKQVASFDK